jgi:hypothetical protein
MVSVTAGWERLRWQRRPGSVNTLWSDIAPAFSDYEWLRAFLDDDNFVPIPGPRRLSIVRNIFLIYMPPSNLEAMSHYEDTIKKKVTLDRVRPFLNRNDVQRLADLFGDRRLAVWGSRNSSRNRATFERMAPGDHLLIVEGERIRFIGKVALKTINPVLSRELWRQRKAAAVEGWELIYFIANPLELDVPFARFARMAGFKGGFQLRGFTRLADERIQAFYQRYDDLYSVLLRLQQKQPVIERPLELPQAPAPLIEVQPEDVDQVLQSRVVSDHVKMQWKLASLGLKAGEKVWVPTADQAKLRTVYNFNEFEPEFAAGIDVPAKFVENIDVVWKEEFRINAAFEVENSTAVYSGLLRFADLNCVAPNSIYPMFIVAPADRRNRVREQLLRPVFKKLDLKDKVKFLPYEAVDDIDRFFSNSASGLSVDLMQGRAETLV